MKTSNFHSLNWLDLGKGLILSILTSAMVIIQQSIESGVLTLTAKLSGFAAIGGGLAYLSSENYPNLLKLLREEWENSMDKKYCYDNWCTFNIEILKKHQYYTKFAQKEWQNFKEKNLKLIETKLLSC